MSNAEFSHITENSVEIIEADGEWLVVVMREGVQETSTFDIRKFAESYAEGQRIGLGLPDIMRA